MALKVNKGNFDAAMTLSDTSKSDLSWCVTHTHANFNQVSHGSPRVTIYSDESLTGWGGVMNHVSTGGPFQRKNRQTTLIILRFYLSCFFTFPILVTWAEELFYAIG